jgi:hypothetical protein
MRETMPAAERDTQSSAPAGAHALRVGPRAVLSRKWDEAGFHPDHLQRSRTSRRRCR